MLSFLSFFCLIQNQTFLYPYKVGRWRRIHERCHESLLLKICLRDLHLRLLAKIKVKKIRKTPLFLLRNSFFFCLHENTIKNPVEVGGHDLFLSWEEKSLTPSTVITSVITCFKKRRVYTPWPTISKPRL